MSTTPTGSVPADHLTLSRPTLAALLLIAALAMRTVLLFAGNALLTPLLGSYEQALLYSGITIVVVDLITIVVAVRLLHRQGRTARAVIGVRLRDTGWALLCFVIVTVAFVVFTFLGNLIAYQGAPPVGATTDGPPLWFGLWCLLVMPVTIALAEELLYRGWAIPELAARTNPPLAVVIAAAFFGLQHAALTALDPQAQIARLITTFLAGALFGGLYLWRRTLWPLIVAHWLLDVIGLGLPMLLFSLR